MLIIGLGGGGCNIAKLFKQQKQYHVELLDSGAGIKALNTVEEYDNIDYKPRKKAIKSASEGILFLCGGGKVTASTLRVLEGLTHVKMTVVYVYPDLEFASSDEKIRNKIHFGVLQEYTRSGLINEMMILDNKQMLNIAGPTTINNHYEKTNYLIYSAIHTLNYCANTKPEFGSLHTAKEISRITTLGFGNIDEKEEKMFFLLDNITETSYIININEEDLSNDVNLLPNIKAMVGENKKLERETSFAIWSTTEDTNYYYTKHYTHFIQEIS